MSRTNTTSVENLQFIARLVEVCETAKPAEIAQLFNVSYQAAKNYMAGRMPDTGVLLNIAENTDFSLHWLLTGTGKKFVGKDESEDTQILSDELWEQIRAECRQIVSKILDGQDVPDEGKVFVLNVKDIKEEKILQEEKLLNMNHE